ncbi:MAG: hypothetical protein RIC06_10440 [Cyclobacteriaceae bacterium]
MEDNKHNYFAFLSAIVERDYNQLLGIIHPNPQFEFPFELIEKNKSMNKRDEIISYLLSNKIKRTYSIPTLLEQTSNSFILVEIRAEEYFPLIKKTFVQELICRVGCLDNQIKYYKEYFNPIIRLEGLLGLNNDDLDHYFNQS